MSWLGRILTVPEIHLGSKDREIRVWWYPNVRLLNEWRTRKEKRRVIILVHRIVAAESLSYLYQIIIWP